MLEKKLKECSLMDEVKVLPKTQTGNEVITQTMKWWITYYPVGPSPEKIMKAFADPNKIPAVQLIIYLRNKV